MGLVFGQGVETGQLNGAGAGEKRGYCLADTGVVVGKIGSVAETDDKKFVPHRCWVERSERTGNLADPQPDLGVPISRNDGYFGTSGLTRSRRNRLVFGAASQKPPHEAGAKGNTGGPNKKTPPAEPSPEAQRNPAEDREDPSSEKIMRLPSRTMPSDWSYR
jgi:hypothetical protein